MDLRYALRSLRKDPGFAVLAIIVMALGIGANTAVFSVVHAVLLKPLAFKDPDRIVTLSSLWKTSGRRGTVSAPDFHDWHDQSTSFAAMAYYDDDTSAVTVHSMAEYTPIATVTPEFFDVFAVRPAIGREFSAEERKSGTGILIGYAWWQSHFGGRPDVLGQPLRMFEKDLTIVGVMPAGFSFPGKTAIWLAANSIFPETESRSAHNYLVVGRLKPAVAMQRAQAEMTGIGARLERQYPDSNLNKSVAVTGMRDSMVGNVRLMLYVLLGAVGLVLLIACANTANLLLARATARTREIAIRAAVGAGRGRIVRQLVVESLLLAGMSGVAGVLLALWGAAALVALAPANVPRLAEAGIDGGVLAFTFGVTVLASLLFGLAPALQASRVDLNDALKQGAARAVVGGGAQSLRGALVVMEIAFSVVLLAGAGLLIKSFQTLQSMPLGFRPEHVLVMQAEVPEMDLDGRRRAVEFYKGLIGATATTPGVEAAAGTRTPPGRVMSNGGYWVDNLPEHRTMAAPQAVFSVVSPGVFNALKIPLKAGRDFNARDTYEAPSTIVINESLARRSFAGQDPLGHTMFCGYDTRSMKPMTIVGVVGDVRQFGPATPPWPEIYMSYQQHPRSDLQVLARTAGDPLALSETLRRMVRDRNPNVPVKFSTLEENLAENVAAPRFRTLLLGIFASLAVVLAMAGIYGVMGYVVGQRSNEIGLRMALGASQGSVLRLVLRQGLIYVALGLALGLAGALAATRLLTSMLFEVKPTDPVTYAAVAVLLAAAALVAGYVPARRASQVDPLIALRQE
ncbi:MAG: ABC transporter permease [Candidatus Sulfopaludibacter sp.]|nr:ABC transporter permease [Candidatus Sulfopaludibacter sp.]